jgi:hypothetical protein
MNSYNDEKLNKKYIADNAEKSKIGRRKLENIVMLLVALPCIVKKRNLK